MIPEIEQPALDIDWFFTNTENIGFVASAGGRLPKSISKSKANIELLAAFFRSLPPISDIEINPKLNEIIPSRQVDEKYLADFSYMAKRGLFSFDKTVLNNFEDKNYHLVASPKTALRLRDLPQEILAVLSETVIHEGITDRLIPPL